MTEGSDWGVADAAKGSEMDRFFFHFSHRTEIVRDGKGRELRDLSAAHRHAMALIHKALLLDEVDWRGWSVRIADADDRSMLSVLFPQPTCSRFGRRSGTTRS
jgi:hypothetical protein